MEIKRGLCPLCEGELSFFLTEDFRNNAKCEKCRIDLTDIGGRSIQTTSFDDNSAIEKIIEDAKKWLPEGTKFEVISDVVYPGDPLQMRWILSLPNHFRIGEYYAPGGFFRIKEVTA